MRSVQIGEIFFDCKFTGWDKKYSTKKALNEHKRTHKSSRHFQCNIWDQKFTQYSSLQKHGRVHDKKKPFKCDYKSWKSAFTQISNLIRHKRIHTGEKPYKWDKCSKSFASGSNLKQHKNTHNSFRKRKVYKCEFCGEDESKNYLYQTSLKKHVQLSHKAEYEKLLNDLEVDKPPILRTQKGQVFNIDTMDRRNSSDQNSTRKRTHESEVCEESKNRLLKPAETLAANRPVTRQYSMLSEVSQNFNLAELLHNADQKYNNFKQDSFNMSKNSSFRVSSKHNSFLLNKQHQDAAILKQFNDKFRDRAFFGEVDEDVGNCKPYEFGIKEYQKSSFKGLSSMKLDDTNTYMFRK